jgi:hypothetical protein
MALLHTVFLMAVKFRCVYGIIFFLQDEEDGHHGFSTINKDLKIVRFMTNWRSGSVGKWMNTGMQNMIISKWYGFKIFITLESF